MRKRQRLRGGGTLGAGHYIKLADLYHFHKDFDKEEEILLRFSESPHANDEELMDIYERIEKISKTRHLLNKPPLKKVSLLDNSVQLEKTKILAEQANIDPLSLISIESEPDIVEISSNAIVTHKHKQTKLSLEDQTITILTLCSIYTGRTEEDELLELSLVLLEYSASEATPFKVINTFTGNRKPTNRLLDKTIADSGIDPDAHVRRPMKKEMILSLFEQADYVVSHKNPLIERRIIITLFPELQNANWHSTQQDIPWRAMGFDSTSLSHIMQSFGRRKPRTSLERAKAISQILQSSEPNNSDLYIERIHYMNPMKAIEWTKEMNCQHLRMQGKKSKTQKWVLGIVAVAAVVVTVIVLYYFNLLQ